MKIIKAQNCTNITMSHKEWCQIGTSSGWMRLAEDIDLTRQKADTDKLFQVMSDFRTDITAFQNIDPQNTEEINKVKEGIMSKLDDIKDNNWVVQLDAEIGLSIQSLYAAINQNNFILFLNILDNKFKKDLNESKAQLDRAYQKQKGESTGVAIGLTETVDDTGDSYA